MFKLSEIKELMKLVDQTSIHELEIEHEGAKLAIRKPGRTEIVNIPAPSAIPTYVPAAPAPVAAQATPDSAASAGVPAADTSHLHQIISPMVGTFYRAPSPEAPAFVNIGDRVSEKTVVCILEAMKLMNPLEAEVNGEIVDILVENGQLVEYGTPLFLVKPQ